MSPMIHIIEATQDQLPVIQKLAYRIWPTAFKGILTNEQISYMLDWMYSLPALEEQFDHGHHFLLAKAEEQCVGYAAYEIMPSSQEAKLHKVYILPAMQGNGIGKMLISEIIDRMKANNKSILLLNVNRYNKAVNFYTKIGFKIIKEVDNPIGNGFFMNDYVMAMTV